GQRPVTESPSAALPGPEDVADALRSGVAPSSLVDGDPAAPPAGGSSVGDQGGTEGVLTDPPAVPAEIGGGGVVVRTSGGTLLAARDTALEQLRADGVADRLAQKDATLWGPDASVLAGTRLGWLDAVATGRALLPALTALADELRAEGVDRVVLAGMGGSSLAPEVVCGTYGRPLVTLDSTDPAQVRAAFQDLERTVVVVSSKSGGTVETDSHRRAARAAFEAAGVDPARRIVVVTDPGSPLAAAAEEEGVRAVFLADPDVGGRYSALTAFGLVPSALAGVDVAALLDDADAVLPTLSDDAGPGLVLGALLGGGAVSGRDKLVLVPGADAPEGFGDWAEQLVAESTGKQGKGLLPVVVEAPGAPGTEPAADSHLVVLGGEPPAVGTAVEGPLGAQFLVWEYATAVAGRVLAIDPFDQPNVQESKDNTGAILDGDSPRTAPPLFAESGVEVSATGDLLADVATLGGALEALLRAVPDRGYLAVMAYLDRVGEARAGELRALLAARLAHPVTFGWAPRFLHSTGQFHKGGPQTGVFLQVTAAVQDDLEVPGKPYTFGVLQAAQSAGDLRALASRDRPVLHLHLTDRAAGLDALLQAARA
ncbi:MAG: glucose-6-phosphate isomerase, partial [Frankiales bacterium]|nr:glucose-6-phosphate isomerase [Frankiales bacterium]